MVDVRSRVEFWNVAMPRLVAAELARPSVTADSASGDVGMQRDRKSTDVYSGRQSP